MTPSQDLHQLIHTLNPSEKRYFRLLAARNAEDVSYIKLFDLILEMPAYDEGQLIAKLDDEKFTRRLSAHKHYLYQYILRTMRNYDTKKRSWLRIRGLIGDGIYLYEKTLFVQSGKRFRQARKQAEKSGDLMALLEIQDWERKVIKRLHNKDRQEQLEARHREKDKLLDQIGNLYEYYDAYDRIFMLSQEVHYSERGERDKRLLEAAEMTALLQNEAAPSSFRARHFFLQTQAIMNQLEGDTEAAEACYTELVEHWEAHPAQIQEAPMRYGTLLANLASYCQVNRHYGKVERLLASIRKLNPDTENARFRLREAGYFHELMLYINTGAFDTAMRLEGRLRTWMKQNQDRINLSRLQAYRYNFSVLGFLTGQWTRSLTWLQVILEEPNQAIRRDIREVALLLRLISQFESGDDSRLEPMLQSTRRLLKHSHKEKSMAFHFLDRFEQLLRAPAGSGREAQWNSFHQAFLEYAIPESGVLGGLEISLWLESKSTAQPIRVLSRSRLAS